MESQSAREVIETTESLTVGDTVEFEDMSGTRYSGDIVELQPHRYEEHKDFLVKGDSNTEDCVLEVWMDPGGAPTHVAVSFEDGSSEEVRAIREL